MKFYTNVQMIGNQFLVRGVENGKRYTHKDEFFPTLFVKSKKNTKYKTLSGEYVGAINLEQLKTVESSIKNMKMLKDLKYMEMTDTFTNTYQTNIQKMKSSLTSARLNLLLLILRLRLSKGSLMLNRAQKRFWQSQSKTIQLSRLLLGELNLLITNNLMLPTTVVTLRKTFFDHS